MKLSEFSTEKAMDILCGLVPYISNISIDEELIDTLKKKLNPAGEELNRATMLALGAQRITEIAPLLLKKHRVDVFGIIATLNEKTVEEIGKQNIIKTMIMIREAIKDEELISFFSSCAGREESVQ